MERKMRQELLFVSEWEQRGIVPNAKPLALAAEPKRVWTLFHYEDPERPPSLPFEPIHRHNAFLEDKIHDWNWSNGMFRYGSRVADSPVWLLLEYE